jgi:hypothetical protein
MPLHEACKPWASSAPGTVVRTVCGRAQSHAVGPTQKIAVNLDANPPVWRQRPGI